MMIMSLHISLHSEHCLSLASRTASRINKEIEGRECVDEQRERKRDNRATVNSRYQTVETKKMTRLLRQMKSA